MSKSKSLVALVAERMGKKESYIRAFISKHPEVYLEKGDNNRYLVTQEQQDILCEAIKECDAKREAERDAREKAHRMSKKDQEYWDSIYRMMESILGYGDEQTLSNSQIQRLKGLLYGKYYASNMTEDKARYSYECLLNTIKYSMPDIRRALNNVGFKDDNHKFNYVMKIIDGNLNTVYTRMKNVVRSEQEAKKQDTSYAVEYVNMFKAKKTKSNKRLNELW